MRRTSIVGLLAGILLLGSVATAQSVIYVKTPDAEIRSGTGLAGPIVARVKQGEKLQILAEERIRYKVKTAAGVEGWISRQKVSTQDPRKGQGNAGGFVREDRSASEMSSATSGRGLRQTDNGGGINSAVGLLNAASNPAPKEGDAATSTTATSNQAGASTTPPPVPPKQPDPKAVEAIKKMEQTANAITDEQVRAFLKAGGIEP